MRTNPRKFKDTEPTLKSAAIRLSHIAIRKPALKCSNSLPNTTARRHKPKRLSFKKSKTNKNGLAYRATHDPQTGVSNGD